MESCRDLYLNLYYSSCLKAGKRVGSSDRSLWRILSIKDTKDGGQLGKLQKSLTRQSN